MCIIIHIIIYATDRYQKVRPEDDPWLQYKNIPQVQKGLNITNVSGLENKEKEPKMMFSRWRAPEVSQRWLAPEAQQQHPALEAWERQWAPEAPQQRKENKQEGEGCCGTKRAKENNHQRSNEKGVLWRQKTGEIMPPGEKFWYWQIAQEVASQIKQTPFKNSKCTSFSKQKSKNILTLRVEHFFSISPAL